MPCSTSSDAPSEADFRVREARAADLPAILEMLADDDLGRNREAPGAAAQDYVRAFAAIEASADNTLLVGECDGAVVACLQLTLIPGLSRRGATRAQIEAVRVAAQARGRGFGERLIAAALDRARAGGARLAQLTSDARRPDAHRFYARLGFAPSHIGFKRELGES